MGWGCSYALLVHIMPSCTCQHECEVEGSWVQDMPVGWIQVAKQCHDKKICEYSILQSGIQLRIITRMAKATKWLKAIQDCINNCNE